MRALRVLVFGCEVCGQRRRCWRRWHVEVVACPTCKREVDEDDAAFGKALGDGLTAAVSAWTLHNNTIGGKA